LDRFSQENRPIFQIDVTAAFGQECSRDESYSRASTADFGRMHRGAHGVKPMLEKWGKWLVIAPDRRQRLRALAALQCRTTRPPGFGFIRRGGAAYYRSLLGA
jgi:hypothetical protein